MLNALSTETGSFMSQLQLCTARCLKLHGLVFNWNLLMVTSGGFLSFNLRCVRSSPRTHTCRGGEGEEITDQVLKIVSLSSWLSVSW